jgi:hypothetical protein
MGMLGETCLRVGPFLEEFSQIKKHVFDIGGFFWVEISFRQDQFAFLDDELDLESDDRVHGIGLAFLGYVIFWLPVATWCRATS